MIEVDIVGDNIENSSAKIQPEVRRSRWEGRVSGWDVVVDYSSVVVWTRMTKRALWRWIV